MRSKKFELTCLFSVLALVALLAIVAGCTPSTTVPSTSPASTTATSTTTIPPTTTTSPTPSPTMTVPPTTTASPSPTSTSGGSGQSVTIDLIAQNIAFDKSTITVPAGASVTVNFTNKDNGIPHNFSIYTNQSATTSIFIGQVITGPASTTYHFTAPTTPGNYFFRCDVHPTIMTGEFIVTP